MKTIKIKKIIDMVNKMNRESTCSSEVRKGWNALLESILMETRNYDGFSYITKDRLPYNTTPGIQVEENGSVTILDDTRIEFSTKAKLLV